MNGAVLTRELKGRSLYHVQATAGLAPRWTIPKEYAEAAYFAASHNGAWPPYAATEVKDFIMNHAHEFSGAPDFYAFLRINRIEIL